MSNLDDLIAQLSLHPEIKILKRVPESFSTLRDASSPVFIASIVDLETMGMDAQSHEIIELGLLSFAFTKDAIVYVVDAYNELNDPGKPIPEEITRITKITDEDVQGKAIDWQKVGGLLSQSHLILCHNSQFDRNFLEQQTPDFIRKIVESKPFGCTINDIDWRARGYESNKLDYLNFKLGFFYEGHRALVDCWATLNLLKEERGAFDELKSQVRKKQTMLFAQNAAFEKKDILKARNYRWSDGAGRLPKCWYITVDNELLDAEKQWLDEYVYMRSGVANGLRKIEISAFNRYSVRATVAD